MVLSILLGVLTGLLVLLVLLVLWVLCCIAEPRWRAIQHVAAILAALATLGHLRARS